MGEARQQLAAAQEQVSTLEGRVEETDRGGLMAWGVVNPSVVNPTPCPVAGGAPLRRPSAHRRGLVVGNVHHAKKAKSSIVMKGLRLLIMDFIAME